MSGFDNLTQNDSSFSNITLLADIVSSEKMIAYVVFFLACLAVASFVIASNVLFIFACYRTRALRTIATKHVHSLAVADMTLGVAMYAQGAFYININSGNLHSIKYLCLCMMAIVSVGLTSSMLSVMLIAIDRYIYIVHPYRYPRFITAQRTTVTIFVAWVMSVLYGSVPFYNHNFSQESGCSPASSSNRAYAASRLVLFIFASSVSGFCHISIQRTAMKHIRKLYPPAKGKKSSSTNSVPSLNHAKNAHGHMTATLKLVKTFFLVHVLFVYSWLPGLVAYTVGSSHRILLNVLAIMAELSTCFNVLVYVFSNNQFKGAIVKVLGCSSPSTSTHSSRSMTTAVSQQ